MGTDSVTLIILAVFALIALVLMLARALMEDLVRTIKIWHELREALRGERTD